MTWRALAVSARFVSVGRLGGAGSPVTDPREPTPEGQTTQASEALPPRRHSSPPCRSSFGSANRSPSHDAQQILLAVERVVVRAWPGGNRTVHGSIVVEGGFQDAFAARQRRQLLPQLVHARSRNVALQRAAPLTEQAVFVGVQGNRLHYTQLGQTFRHYVNAAGVNERKRVTPHTLRHVFASELLHAGANLRQIQELLGHKHLDSTQRYTRVNAHELRGAIKRLRWVG